MVLHRIAIYLFVISILSLEICNGYNDDEEMSSVYTYPNTVDDTIQRSGRLKTIDKNGDNLKPIFSKCSSYSPSIKEEQPKGEFVIDVHADDKDPLENGGTINYTIVKREGDRSYFTIDNKIGRITTNLVSEFDRDEPSRLKEIYITVQATDNGRPVLADLCTFKVTILDINDNAPGFDKYEYEEKVSQDLKSDSEVMRVVAYDIDDGDNSKLTYTIRSDGTDTGRNFDEYFRIAADTGVLYLKKALTNKRDTIFNSLVVVQDNPKIQSESRESTAAIKITVVGFDKQPPSFTKYPTEKILIPENYKDYINPVVTLKAESNIEDPEVIFELIKGLTTQTNKDSTFVLEQNGTEAFIKLGRALDYETVTEFQLTVRCTNKDSWSVIRTIDIEIEDVNDEIPQFIELVSGSVLENEEPPAEVMQVRAVDKDGTLANSKVTYELADNKDLFAIDEHNGKVTTKQKLDREQQSVYNVIIVAKDNSKSALTNKEYNSASQTFRITIEDRNDNKPQFTSSYYVVDRVPENSDIGKEIIEVKAVDKDTASLIHYKIVAGNVGNAFLMENTTGRIKVNALLDYEKIESYNLTIEANDGIYSDAATVHVKISNVNDELPIFEEYNKNITIEEERIPEGCIITLKAYDPDIKDRNADQHIVYRVEDKDFLNVDKYGCVRLTKKLDRDEPHGYPTQQAFIQAYDDGDSPTSKFVATEIFIILIDINDNAPFLNMTEVVWYENEPAGKIVTLKARDFDGPDNGPPFSYNLPANVGEDIKSKFSISGDELYAEVEFDREEQKYYYVPVEITDSGKPDTLTGTSILKVIIGDRNDNRMESGSSEIFVYNYEGSSPDIQIGRVYVEDPDDWDLDDKTFRWDGIEAQNFRLNRDNGTITMLSGTLEGKYTLSFKVVEEHLPLIESHEVEAFVTITIKEIPEEAVRKSGSIRINGTTIEDFVWKPSLNELSKKDMLQKYLAKILNTSKEENVDVFTVLPVAGNQSYVDVRYSAHGSPYYAAEHLNSKTSLNKYELEKELDISIIMISINECMEETACPSKSSCTNILNIKKEPAVVFTNKTSFVGVKAVVEASCECAAAHVFNCYNGGTPLEESTCNCPDGFDGPRCELLGIGFTGDGWAMYPPFEACNNSEIRLEIVPQSDNGLIFYVGPLAINPLPLANDFMSLELRNGFPVLLLDYGTGTTEVMLDFKKLTDGLSHSIKILFQPNEILLSVDDCHESKCQKLQGPKAPNQLLNVNGPLQVGGTRENLKHLASLLNWNFTPTNIGFNGCIKNLTYNGFVYNLGEPGEHKNAKPNCNYGVARAVSFGIDSNFLVAILVCIAILLILLLAVVVHRRKQDNWNEKDTDDIRETIISYEDEGGGEVDTGFDLSVLRRLNDDDYPLKEKAPEVPDISGFLDNKKDNCDRDANSYPFDDVRYYAYEGDGNSTGSLSSLASCTDDGDLKFNYLSSFGPRFRKLADMYGEDPSDEDSQDGGEESWC